MYGLVNKAVEDLVISSAGLETWQRVKAHAALENLQLLDTTNYEDEVTYSLVHSASAILDMPVDVLLHAFGRHWVLYTGEAGWAKLFSAGGDDFVSFLENLDEMHARVNMAMPDGRMPGFSLTENNTGFMLDYHSSRQGFAPMVLGVLEGLAEQFEEDWTFEHVDTREQHGLDTFQLIRETPVVVGNLRNAS